MQTFSPSAKPVSSPWGDVVRAEQHIAGVWFVHTLDHGGYLLSEERQAAMSEALRVSGNAYEEDLHYIRVLIAFSDELLGIYSAENLQSAKDILQQWCPDEFQAHFNIELDATTSIALRARDKINASIGQLCVKTTWRHGKAKWVPKGMLGLAGSTLTGLCQKHRPLYAGNVVYALCDEANFRISVVNTFAELGATIINTPPHYHW